MTLRCRPAEEDGCDSAPCLNGGVCRGYRQTPLCVCKEGFQGDRCQTREYCEDGGFFTLWGTGLFHGAVWPVSVAP